MERIDLVSGHFYVNKKNGELYLYLFEADHTETGEVMAVYSGPGGKRYVRPMALFLEKFQTPLERGTTGRPDQLYEAGQHGCLDCGSPIPLDRDRCRNCLDH